MFDLTRKRKKYSQAHPFTNRNKAHERKKEEDGKLLKGANVVKNRCRWEYLRGEGTNRERVSHVGLVLGGGGVGVNFVLVAPTTESGRQQKRRRRKTTLGGSRGPGNYKRKKGGRGWKERADQGERKAEASKDHLDLGQPEEVETGRPCWKEELRQEGKNQGSKKRNALPRGGKEGDGSGVGESGHGPIFSQGHRGLETTKVHS